MWLSPATHKPIFEIMTIYRVNKTFVSEHNQQTELSEIHFSTKRKANNWIDNEISKESEFVTSKKDVRPGRLGYDRIVNLYFGNEGAKIILSITPIEVA